MFSVLICVLLVLQASFCLEQERTDFSDVTLYLLNVQPFPDDRPNAGWDRALELIPAGELAIEQINNRSDLLPGYRLELINVDSEACGISVISKGLVNTYEHLVDNNIIVAGVVGLLCSSVTGAIAPLVNLFDRVMVAGSSSPFHRNTKVYPRLHHTISASAVHSDTVLRMMIEFGWQRVSVVHDSKSVIYLSSVAYFANAIGTTSSLNVVHTLPITLNLMPQVIPILRQHNSRVIFVITTVPEAARLMCEAYKTNSLWPTFVYIFQGFTTSHFLATNHTTCTKIEMAKAIEGSFLLRYKLEADPETLLISGLTYKQYHDEYVKQIEKQQNSALSPNIYANVAYDEVWALALALNNSIEVLNTKNLTFEDYNRNQTAISDVIQEQLSNMSFQGATGFIKFKDNQETVSSTVIYQVRNGTANVIGVYNPQLSENISRVTYIDIENIPSDRFRTVNRYPLWLVVIAALLITFCYSFTVVVLVTLFYYHKRPEIKASSPYLSILMFIGCFMLYTAVLCKALFRGVIITGLPFICSLEAWTTFNGLNLIFGTLLLRLLRVKHVFKTFGRTSKFWSDPFLALAVVACCLLGNIILVAWTVKDPFQKITNSRFVSSSTHPYFETTVFCFSENLVIWTVVSFVYCLILLVFTVFLAIQTRHIKLNNFKDTKKINAYAFASVIIAALGLSLTFILRNNLGSDIVEHVTLLLLGILCQCFLFVPKLFSSKPNFGKKPNSLYKLPDNKPTKI